MILVHSGKHKPLIILHADWPQIAPRIDVTITHILYTVQKEKERGTHRRPTHTREGVITRKRRKKILDTRSIAQSPFTPTDT